jgi:hypothetical protein
VFRRYFLASSIPVRQSLLRDYLAGYLKDGQLLAALRSALPLNAVQPFNAFVDALTEAYDRG